MCGIAGIYPGPSRRVDERILRRMTGIQSHRGPDDEGFYLDDGVGLGQRRLSIIDLSGGKQPIHNEDKTVWTVFNGEIFNYIELREALEKQGHRFYTHTDTEVIVHLYEQYGLGFADHLNGQFGIAVWDVKERKLVLARDRVGIRPVFHAKAPDGSLLFASEMKALFAHPALKPEMDPAAIEQIFTLWVNVPPRTMFKGIQELPPGCLLVAQGDDTRVIRYWKPDFPDAGAYEDKPLEYYKEKLRELLFDATTLQLRADVPVGSYLSGGIDSSIISALVKKHHNPGLVTFSVAFKDKAYDERPYQEEMSKFLGTDHRFIEADYPAIADAYSDVIWFSERPMIRTAPAPLFLLAGLVRRSGMKVVLTGEGADEIFGGYNIFREDKVRRFWARQPDSKFRPLLLSRLYAYVNKNPQAQAFWRMFFRKGLTDTDNPYYSHQIRWSNTSQILNLFQDPVRKGFQSPEAFKAELDAYLEPERMMRWDPLCRAQYLEMVLFMSGYLLSSQGDRMMMGQSIEGRFPFLDHRLIEFAATIPPKYKIRILEEKHILKKSFTDLVPERIASRPKQPYRAPISECFLRAPDSEASSMLEPEVAKKYGYFEPEAVRKLMDKVRKADGKELSARDDMAVVGIVSLHLLHKHFMESLPARLAALPG